MTHPKDIVEYYIGNDSDKFALWAWGDGYKELNFKSCEPVIEWNKLHGDLIEFRCDGNPIDDIRKMVELWEKSQELDFELWEKDD